MPPASTPTELLSSLDLTDELTDSLRQNLLDWFDANKRDLPWRQTDDPYAIWVSEIMLQQTQVKTVKAYYQRWLERFPDIQSLADAPLEDVLDVWAGLGYYRRARSLHAAATDLADAADADQDPLLPTTLAGLKKLPGIGAYTAGAIASIAYGLRAPLVDGNVERVFARIFAIPGDPKARENQKIFWAIADALVHPEEPGDFNQSLMELGATVCTPKNPSCLLCPVRDDCRGLMLGDPTVFPAKVKRAKQKKLTVRAAIVTATPADGVTRYLVVRRPDEGLLAGLLEVPTTDHADPKQTLAQVLGRLFARIGVEPASEPARLGDTVHVFSHIKMTFEVHRLDLGEVKGALLGDDELRCSWLREDELEDAAFSSAQRKVLAVGRGE